MSAGSSIASQRPVGAVARRRAMIALISSREVIRATRSLSGGERFPVSLALALGLSGLEGRTFFVDTLLIDEGFGSLDAETLDVAADALEPLQGRGQKVGVITHVAAMIERIAVQVRFEKRGAGRSEIRISDWLGVARRGRPPPSGPCGDAAAQAGRWSRCQSRLFSCRDFEDEALVQHQASLGRRTRSVKSKRPARISDAFMTGDELIGSAGPLAAADGTRGLNSSD